MVVATRRALALGALALVTANECGLCGRPRIERKRHVVTWAGVNAAPAVPAHARVRQVYTHRGLPGVAPTGWRLQCATWTEETRTRLATITHPFGQRRFVAACPDCFPRLAELMGRLRLLAAIRSGQREEVS